MVILHTELGLIWATPWSDEKYILLKFANREIRKYPYEDLTVFLGNLYQINFLFYPLITMVILHTEFSLLWTTPWPDEKDVFLKFANREKRKSF